jgi:hypothetical protein
MLGGAKGRRSVVFFFTIGSIFYDDVYTIPIFDRPGFLTYLIMGEKNVGRKKICAGFSRILVRIRSVDRRFDISKSG